VALANKILARNEKVFRMILWHTYKERTAEVCDQAYPAFRNSIESVVAKPEDVAGNWMLECPEGYPVSNTYSPSTIRTHWRPEGYRSHAYWPVGKSWNSAAAIVASGELV
jgi:hypothetical protein